MTILTPDKINVGTSISINGAEVINSSGDGLFTGDVTVQGNLFVSGSTTTINTELQTADRYILLNSEYTGNMALSSGFVFNVDPDPVNFTIVDITSNVISVGGTDDPSSELAAGDFVLLQAPNTSSNAGIFEVLSVSSTSNTITIDTTPTEAFSGNNLIDDAVTGGVIVGVKVAVMRSNAAGDMEAGTGSAAPLAYSAFQTSVPSLSAVLGAGPETSGNILQVTSGDRIDSATSVPLILGSVTASSITLGSATTPVSAPGWMNVGTTGRATAVGDFAAGKASPGGFISYDESTRNFWVSNAGSELKNTLRVGSNGGRGSITIFSNDTGSGASNTSSAITAGYQSNTLGGPSTALYVRAGDSDSSSGHTQGAPIYLLASDSYSSGNKNTTTGAGDALLRGGKHVPTGGDLNGASVLCQGGKGFGGIHGGLSLYGGNKGLLTGSTIGGLVEVEAGSSSSAAGGPISVLSGSSVSAAAGSISIDCGTGASTGAITIGTTNAGGITIGRTSQIVTLPGTLNTPIILASGVLAVNATGVLSLGTGGTTSSTVIGRSTATTDFVPGSTVDFTGATVTGLPVTDLSAVLVAGNASGANDIVMADTQAIVGEGTLTVEATSTGGGDLVLGARGASITLNEAGAESLSTTSFGSTSIIGAINELGAIATAGIGTLAQTLATGEVTGGNSILVTSGDTIDSATGVPLVLGPTTASSVALGSTTIPVSAPGWMNVGNVVQANSEGDFAAGLTTAGNSQLRFDTSTQTLAMWSNTFADKTTLQLGTGTTGTLLIEADGGGGSQDVWFRTTVHATGGAQAPGINIRCEDVSNPTNSTVAGGDVLIRASIGRGTAAGASSPTFPSNTATRGGNVRLFAGNYATYTNGATGDPLGAFLQLFGGVGEPLAGGGVILRGGDGNGVGSGGGDVLFHGGDVTGNNAGGIVTIRGGDGSTGTGALVSIIGGAGTTGGPLVLDSGSGGTTGGSVSLGTANAGTVTIGRAAIATKINGWLNVGSATAATALGDIATSDGTRGLDWDSATGIMAIDSGIQTSSNLMYWEVDSTDGINWVFANTGSGAQSSANIYASANAGNIKMAAHASTQSVTGPVVPSGTLLLNSNGMTAGMNFATSIDANVRQFGFWQANSLSWQIDTSRNLIGTGARSISATGALTISSTGILSLDSTTNAIQTNATSITADGALSVLTTGATALTLDAGGAAAVNIGTTNASAVNVAAPGITTTIGETIAGVGANAATWNIKTASAEVDFSVSGTATGLIPAGAMVIGVSTRVFTTPVSGGSVTGGDLVVGYEIGDGVDVDRWGSITGTADGTTSDPTDYTDNTLSFNNTASAADVILTGIGGTPTGGTVRVILTYISLTAPTS